MYSRREAIATTAAFATGGAASGARAAPAGTAALPTAFSFNGTYLNSADTHPMSDASAEAVAAYLSGRRRYGFERARDVRSAARAGFARLINATPEEVAVVPSTQVAENLVGQAIGLGPHAGVLTDSFHYYGSLALYGQRAAEGMPLAVVAPRDNHIRLEDMMAAVTPQTRLIALTTVCNVNGFEHDLEAVCEFAHSRGILVYTDIVQSVGAIPFDVRKSRVDFCGAGSYKWLMGDFGAGFMYVRADHLATMRRPQIGTHQLQSYTSHVHPYDPPGPPAGDWRFRENAAGRVEVGSIGTAALAAAVPSLEYLNTVGVGTLASRRQPLVDHLKRELASDDFILLSPADWRTPIVAFAVRDAPRTLGPKLTAAGVTISVYENRIRISPSFFNTPADVERLVGALKA